MRVMAALPGKLVVWLLLGGVLWNAKWFALDFGSERKTMACEGGEVSMGSGVEL